MFRFILQLQGSNLEPTPYHTIICGLYMSKKATFPNCLTMALVTFIKSTVDTSNMLQNVVFLTNIIVTKLTSIFYKINILYRQLIILKLFYIPNAHNYGHHAKINIVQAFSQNFFISFYQEHIF